MNQAVVNKGSINRHRSKKRKMASKRLGVKQRERAVDCENYFQLYDYVCAGLQNLDDQDDKVPDTYASARPTEIDILLMKNNRSKRT